MYISFPTPSKIEDALSEIISTPPSEITVFSNKFLDNFITEDYLFFYLNQNPRTNKSTTNDEDANFIPFLLSSDLSVKDI